MNKFTDKSIFREAKKNDIPRIQIVRHSVKENRLSDPGLVTDRDCEEYLFNRGKGWVCEIEGRVIAFAIADLKDNNIWALFVDPAFEGIGIGRTLHDSMMDWYFSQTNIDCWLGTAQGSRAEYFYRNAGWTEADTHSKSEIKLKMKKETWLQHRAGARDEVNQF